MDLFKKKIHMNHQKDRKSMQIIFDEDILIPDELPDAAEVMMSSGLIVPELVKPNAEKLNLRGKLSYRVLLLSTGGALFALEGEQDFQEVMNYPGLTERDMIGGCKWTIEDLRVTMVNDRKLRLNAIVVCEAAASQLDSEEAATAIRDVNEFIFTKNRHCSMLQLILQNHDSVRIRDDISLAGNKPNIGDILWKDAALYQVDYQVLEGKLQIAGELEVFILYLAEDGNGALQCFEKRVPFSREVEYSDCAVGQVPMILVSLAAYELEAKPDYDGENRTIGLDAVLDLDIKCYAEEEEDLLADAYEIGYVYELTRRKAQFDELLMKNMATCKVSQSVELDERVLQVCHCHAKVNIDSANVVEDAIAVEGSLEVQIIYMGADEQSPIHVWNDVLSIQCSIETNGADIEEGSFELTPYLSQLNVVVTGASEAEIKAVVTFDTLATRRIECEVVEAVNREVLTEEAWEKIPGICGYIVQEQDDIWELAKSFQTSPDHIRAFNGISGQPAAGERLLVIKEARGE